MPKDAILPNQVLSVGDNGQVSVPSEDFISSGNFTREGADLVITTSSGETAVVEGYFMAEDAPDLVSPEGSILTAELLGAFLTPTHVGQYANASRDVMNDVSPAGQMVDVLGDVFVMRADGTKVKAEPGTVILQGDTIEATDDGAANMIFADNSSFAVSEGARLSVDEYIYDAQTKSGSSFFSMLKGAFVYTSGVIGKEDPENVNIETPVGSIGIRGTIVMGQINPAGQTSEITIIDGAVVVSNAAATLVLNDMYETVQLTGSNDAGQTSVVDQTYLENTYSFDDNFEGFTYDPMGGANSSEPAPDSQGTDGETGDAGNPTGEPTQTASDGTEQQPVDSNPVVSQMVNLQLQQDLQTQVGDESVDTNTGGGDTGGTVGGTGTGDTGGDTGGAGAGAGAGDFTAPADTAGPTLGAGSEWYNGTGIGSSAINIIQYADVGFRLGTINAVDASGPVTFNITSGNTGGAFAIGNDGDIFVNSDLAVGTNSAFTLDIEMTDAVGNTTTLSGVNITVDLLVPPRTLTAGTAGDDGPYVDAGGNDLYWAGDGDDRFIGTVTGAQDIYFGGRGSDLFTMNDLNFQLISGGYFASGGLAADTSVNAFVTTGLAGDVVQLSPGITGTLDLTGVGAHVNKFKGIDAFEFRGSPGQVISLDTDGVAMVTDQDNTLHIWGGNGGGASQFVVNFNGEFSLITPAGPTETWQSNSDPSVTVVLHETGNDEIAVS